MPSFRDLSINLKLTALSVLTSATALLIACAAFVAYDYVNFRKVVARKLVIEAEIIGANSTAALVFRDPGAAQETLEALRVEPHIIAAAIYAQHGEPFATYRGATLHMFPVPSQLPSVSEGYHFSGDQLTVIRRIIFEGETIGHVMIWSELQEINARVLRYLNIALAVLIASVGIAFLISWWPKRIIMQPILNLVDTAHTVSEKKDYSVRAIEVGKDELGVLVHAFNEMLAQIEKRNRELLEARDAALESSRLKSAFLANMSHEIRTPLNLILGYNSIIEDVLRGHGDEESLSLVEPIRRASVRLMTTINGILDISSIETNTFEVEPVVVVLAPLIERQVEDLSLMASQKGIALRFEAQVRDVAVLFDEYSLSQALVNLIQNAIKFTEEGEVVVTLSRHQSGQLCVHIRDTGIGIDADYQPLLFQPFTQENWSYTRPFEGTGLGLALTKRYLELNGADIAVTSEKGVGSTFTILFGSHSEVAAPSVPALEDTPVAPVAVDPISTPQATVLVVEDDSDSRGYMRTILEPHYTVLEAMSGAEVDAQLAAHADVAIILMDFSLKGDEDGVMITQRLRQTSAWKDTPIIATTAHAFPADRTRALGAGCSEFLAKPINPQTLIETMKELLAAH